MQTHDVVFLATYPLALIFVGWFVWQVFRR